jgi:hypothetical protein
MMSALTGVVRMVHLAPRLANSAAMSATGMRCPGAKYGRKRMCRGCCCGSSLVVVAMDYLFLGRNLLPFGGAKLRRRKTDGECRLFVMNTGGDLDASRVIDAAVLFINFGDRVCDEES